MKKIILVLVSISVFVSMYGCGKTPDKTPDKTVSKIGIMGNGNQKYIPGSHVGGL